MALIFNCHLTGYECRTKLTTNGFDFIYTLLNALFNLAIKINLESTTVPTPENWKNDIRWTIDDRSPTDEKKKGYRNDDSTLARLKISGDFFITE